MKIILSSILLAFSGSLFAQTISTEAPSVSSCGTTVPKNSFQIETGIGIRFGGFSPNQSFASNLFRLGITERIELRLTSGIIKGNHFYFSPIQVGAKFQFIKDPNKKTKVALITHFEIPEVKHPHLYANVNMAVSHQLADKHSLGYNIGYSYSKQVFSKEYSMSAENINLSLIYSYSVSQKLSLFVEGYGNLINASTYPFYSRSSGFDFGVLYLLRDNIQINYAFGRGLYNETNFHSIGFNILLNAKK